MQEPAIEYLNVNCGYSWTYGFSVEESSDSSLATFDSYLSLSTGLDPEFTYFAQELEE